MNDVPPRFGQSNGGNDPSSPDHAPDEWAAVLARTVAHLAAQLTMTQIRLRALASELSNRDPGVDAAVRTRLQMLAITETGRYLRENLGEALVDLIDVDALEREIIEFLSSPTSD
jgi:hypothetical protein